MFASKYNCPGQDPVDSSSTVPFFVRNRSLKVLQSFTESMDDQTDQPSYFRDVSRDTWNRFINKQVEQVLSRPFPTLNFAVATGNVNHCIWISVFKLLQLLKDYNITSTRQPMRAAILCGTTNLPLIIWGNLWPLTGFSNILPSAPRPCSLLYWQYTSK